MPVPKELAISRDMPSMPADVLNDEAMQLPTQMTPVIGERALTTTVEQAAIVPPEAAPQALIHTADARTIPSAAGLPPSVKPITASENYTHPLMTPKKETRTPQEILAVALRGSNPDDNDSAYQRGMNIVDRQRRNRQRVAAGLDNYSIVRDLLGGYGRPYRR